MCHRETTKTSCRSYENRVLLNEKGNGGRGSIDVQSEGVKKVYRSVVVLHVDDTYFIVRRVKVG